MHQGLSLSGGFGRAPPLTPSCFAAAARLPTVVLAWVALLLHPCTAHPSLGHGAALLVVPARDPL